MVMQSWKSPDLNVNALIIIYMLVILLFNLKSLWDILQYILYHFKYFLTLFILTWKNCKSYPRCEYVGLTSRPFRLRLAEHKQNVRSKNLDTPSGGHFNQQGHELSHLGGLVLEHVKSSDPFVLRAREFLYIQKFDTFRNGLNGEH